MYYIVSNFKRDFSYISIIIKDRDIAKQLIIYELQYEKEEKIEIIKIKIYKTNQSSSLNNRARPPLLSFSSSEVGT